MIFLYALLSLFVALVSPASISNNQEQRSVCYSRLSTFGELREIELYVCSENNLSVCGWGAHNDYPRFTILHACRLCDKQKERLEFLKNNKNLNFYYSSYLEESIIIMRHNPSKLANGVGGTIEVYSEEPKNITEEICKLCAEYKAYLECKN